ncbi:MAG: replicative DNA helicase, partial [Oscillospiraceae bacterium]|nr:replicative DNA helicase [Oscillospiraceae bacterium]
MADNKLALTLDALGVNLPYSTEAEQAVLGAVLVDDSVLDDVCAVIKPDYFYNKQNAAIFREMMLLQSVGKPIDFVTVLDAVVSAGVFASAEDAKVYLFSVTETVPAVSNAVTYAKIVADKYVTRTLINACRDVIESSVDGQTQANELLDLAEQKIYDIRGGKDSSEMSRIMDVSYQVLTDLEKLTGEDREQFLGLPTGYAYLDKITTGLNRSDLIILAARPSVGKTSFALNIAEHAGITKEKKVAFFSLEMSKEQLVSRMLSSKGQISGQNLRMGKLSDKEWERLIEAGDILSKA